MCPFGSMPSGRPRRALRSPITSPTAAAGLLLVARMRLRGGPDRLQVRDTGRLEQHVDAEALLQATEHDLDVNLREAGDDLLTRRLVAMQVDRRVLFLQLTQAVGDLV